MILIKRTVDQTNIRSINQRVILNKIYNDEPISRAELARELCLSKSAMTENISALLSTGIIEEVGSGVSMSSGGRKPILLKFNRSFKYIIAIELNFEDPIFVLANLGGEIINKFTVNISSDSPYSARLELVLNAVRLLLSSDNLNENDLAIISISCPGIYDSESHSFFANLIFANWNMGDLSKRIETAFNTPVLVVNDVNAAAMGEFTYGAGKNAKNLVYISGGLGLGAGIILGGSIYNGSTGCSGEISNEIAMVNSNRNNRHYGFKNLGDSVNIGALSARIRKESPTSTIDTLKSLGKTLETASFKDLITLWEMNDEFVHQCIYDIAVILGSSISNIVCLLNCDFIIFGGEYTVFSSQMLPIINEIVAENAFSPVKVICSQLKKDSGIYGLFALSKEIIFDNICSKKTE